MGGFVWPWVKIRERRTEREWRAARDRQVADESVLARLELQVNKPVNLGMWPRVVEIGPSAVRDVPAA